MFVRLLVGYKGLKPLPWRAPCPASHPKPAHRDSSGGFEHQRGEAAGTVCLHGQRPRGNTWISCCSPDGGAPSSPIPLKQLKNCVEKEKPIRWEPFPDTAAALLHPQLLGGKRHPNLLGWGGLGAAAPALAQDVRGAPSPLLVPLHLVRARNKCNKTQEKR